MSNSEYADADVDLATPRREMFSEIASNMEVMAPSGSQSLAPRQVGDLFGSLTTAQPVIRERNQASIMQTIKGLAASFGDTYVYSWDVNDKNSKRADKKTTIEGPTIKLAMDLAREFGNCSVDVREIEYPTHWVFYSRFTDLQTGYTLTRAFRQRKNAMAGKYEDDRKLDMAYQNGQSKAERNVVVNALRNYVEYMMEEAKKSTLDLIKANKDTYLKRIENAAKKHDISEESLAAYVGRTRNEWTVRDIASLYAVCKAIWDGMTHVEDVFPKDGPQIDKPTATKTTPKADADGVVDEQQTTTREGDGAAKGAAATSAEAEPAAVTGKSPAAGRAEPSAEPKPKKETAKKTADAPKAESAKPAARPRGLMFDEN